MHEAKDIIASTPCGSVSGLQGEFSIAPKSNANTILPSTLETLPVSLADTYGYPENSRTNAMGLIQNLTKPPFQYHPSKSDTTIPSDKTGIFNDAIEQMPTREILDILIQFFIAEVNWTSQLIYPPSFLAQYQRWWVRAADLRYPNASPSVADLEFAALILSVAALASQFMPSHYKSKESVCHTSFDLVRDTCIQVGDRLAILAASISPRGSLLRVQRMCFTGLSMSCEGKMTESWALLDRAVRMTHELGYHQVSQTSTEPGMDEIEWEMRRRVYCNLYIWDGILSREMDREPLLAQTPRGSEIPRMSLTPGADQQDFGVPDLFTERILQLHLGAFWKRHRCKSSSDEVYEPLVAEERLEVFQKEFLSNVPATFALDAPDRQWDEQMRWLPLQRQLFRTTVYESICQNFRPLLLLHPEDLGRLPAYKQVLIETQRRVLARAALDMLQAISTLYNMLEPLQRRSIAVIVPIFEASVLLSCLCIQGAQSAESRGFIDGLDRASVYESSFGKRRDVSRDCCLRAAHGGLLRLKSLAKVSIVAETGAANLSQFLEQVDNLTTADDTAPDGQMLGHISTNLDFQPYEIGDVVGKTAAYDIPNLFSDDFLQSGSFSDSFENADCAEHFQIPDLLGDKV
ncbi:hypothetical protein PFICI_06670 [Pestalotiopsis fici W106-1]|uniref:Xylanolytic transcriptional activator regulatory domain-containing protein n=1 Tax=Pestalotiopsis fici (strain W106-1 / CGMCC3.15140) TaxID=1229662 RepID=W3X6C4_PESFW|nr:uncharacterized protein PFICI_06670 [Pestalotiopsis fici W106-1]ETS81668.1 hypothetical protein PFICI_06670 [Pestalotiopsis fici W106-1]